MASGHISHYIWIYWHSGLYKHQFSSVQLLSHVWLFVTPWITARQVSLSITNSRVHPNPCPSSQLCHPTISSSVIPFSSCPQSFPSSGSFKWVSSLRQVVKVLEFQLQHQNMTRWTFVSKVLSLLFNMQSRFVIAFLPRSKCLLILWLH